MKNFLTSLLLFTATYAFSQDTSAKKLQDQEVEIACGECMFKMPGKGCNLAIRIGGIGYFVDGRDIDDFGDAHADDGFCNAISKAKVTGEIKDKRFKEKSIQLIKPKKP